VTSSTAELISEKQLWNRWQIENREAFVGWFEKFHWEHNLPVYLYGKKENPGCCSEINLLDVAFDHLMGRVPDHEYGDYKKAYLFQKLQTLDVRFKTDDIEAFEDLYPILKSETRCLPGDKARGGKKDYRTGQWTAAIPIAKNLQTANQYVTLQEIKDHPPFKACFRDGLPQDNQLRRKLNKAGVKLAPGRRKQKT